MKYRQRHRSIFIDESIHDKLGYIVTAFIYSRDDLEYQVSSALLSVGLKPKIDEYKSGIYMANYPEMQALRDKLLNIASDTKIAINISSSQSRNSLGHQCLKSLSKIILKNGIATDKLYIYFDEDIINNPNEIDTYKQAFDNLKEIKIYPNEDSIIRMEIQVADVVAHSIAQIVKEDLTGKNKMLDIGGPNTGYEKGTIAPLGWILKMSLRYSFFIRPVIYKSNIEKIDICRNPLIIDNDDDIVDSSIEPELIGWGIQIDNSLNPKIKDSVRNVLGQIWLGCIH